MQNKGTQQRSVGLSGVQAGCITMTGSTRTGPIQPKNKGDAIQNHFVPVRKAKERTRVVALRFRTDIDNMEPSRVLSGLREVKTQEITSSA